MTAGFRDTSRSDHESGRSCPRSWSNVSKKVIRRVIDPDTARSGADNVLISG